MSDAASIAMQDSLVNLMSGLGTGKDKTTHGRFQAAFLDKVETDALYASNALARTIVDAVADDMTRSWREWQSTQAHIEAIESAERKLDVRGKVNAAMKAARLYGGSALIIGTGDIDPSLPLDPERVGRGGLKYLTVLNRYEIGVGALQRDPLSPWFGEPEHYVLSRPYGGQVDVHPSRVVRFHGAMPVDRMNAPDSWGDSVLQCAYDELRNAKSTAQAMASLMQEAKLDVISIPQLTTSVGDAGYRTRLLQRFSLANASKSINNALLLDKEETWETRQIHFSGIPEVMQSFMDHVAAAANIPVSRLLGKSPTGLNATGDSDVRHYYDTLSSRQETDLRPGLARLDECLIRHALGRSPRNVNYRFSSLWQMSDGERAELDRKRAETAKFYVEANVIGRKGLNRAVLNRLIEDGTYPGLADIPAEDLAPDPLPKPAPKAKAPKPEAVKEPA